jgi:hypothetical protein
VAWQVSWERERLDRLLHLMNEREDVAVGAGPAPLSWLRDPSRWVFEYHSLQRDRPQTLARLRAAQLMVALRLYQSEKGKAPATLDALVPEYLPEVPADPYDGRPFRYRLSAGERVEWPADDSGHIVPAGALRREESPTRRVAAGQGVLWCVGEDCRDDGGRRQRRAATCRPGEDQVFLVPLPPRGGRQGP